MEEFRLAKKWRVITYISGVALVALASWLFYFAATSPFGWTMAFIAVVGLAFLCLALYAVQDARKGKVIFTDEAVQLTDPFGNRRLLFDDVKGYRFTENYIILEPENPKLKKIRISKYLENQNELRLRLQSYWEDLDYMEKLEEEDEIVTNQEFGMTEEVVYERLLRLRKITKFFNRGSWIILAWLFFYPKPYDVALGIAIVYPILAILLCYIYRGWMNASDDEKTAYPSVAEAVILPSIALALRAIIDVNTISYQNGWWIIILFTVAMFFAYQLPTRGFRKRKKQDYVFVALFPLFTFCYSIGTVVTINWRADASNPFVIESPIIDKRSTSGRSKTYYLDVPSNQNASNKEDLKVSYDMFQIANVGDTLTIYKYTGYLQMEWWEVELKED